MSKTKALIEDIFSKTGAISNVITGYSPRKVQVEMAIAVMQALEKYQVLIAEAGTGTGKTYAYLIPSILSGKRIIVSTGTKNLQDQLFHRDIPLIRKALGVPFKVAILKGRTNYVCLHRLNTYLQADFISSEVNQSLHNVKRWVDQHQEGEIEHISNLPTHLSLTSYMTSTTDNCLGQDCAYFSKCYLLKARRQAQDADLLVINHHLFFADTQLKDSGINELLPDSHAIIFDEAHQLHEIATHFLGESISGRQIIYLARDIKAEQQAEAPDMSDLIVRTDALITAMRDLQKAFGSVSKGAWEFIVNKPQMKRCIEDVQDKLIHLSSLLESASIRGRGLENCWRRMSELMQKFKHLTTTFPSDQIHWYDAQESNFSINHTPINISGYFQKLIEENKKAWIFTSATLSVSGDFSHFESHLGLPNATRLYLESPFDYSKQALLYIPNMTVLPNEQSYVEEVLKFIIPLLKLTQGQAFLLFTSHKALNQAALLLQDQIDFPLLVQGSAPKSQLLEKFCSLDHAVLLGTNSFWEGVDVKGNKLSCVIIDKIPFSAPDDPILKTRLDHYKKQGKSPFREYQLPQAVITLRQGAGRLIRDITDRGLLVICDPRLMTMDYGKIFLNSLPSMTLTQSFDKVIEFFKGNGNENISD